MSKKNRNTEQKESNELPSRDEIIRRRLAEMEQNRSDENKTQEPEKKPDKKMTIRTRSSKTSTCA